MTDKKTQSGFEEEDAVFTASAEDPYACSPEHDAYLRREVEATLARKARGEVSFLSLDAAARKFLPDAC